MRKQCTVILTRCNTFMLSVCQNYVYNRISIVGLIIFIESMLQMSDCAFCCHYRDNNDDVIGMALKHIFG
jgi:hypothetical protein